MSATDESGLRRTETYWVTEVTDANGNPETPADPAFNLWSKTISNEGGESSAEHEESLGLGDAVATDKYHSVESHERTITYELCRFPEDGSGNAQDPFYYASKRDIDNKIESTLSHLKIVKRASILENNTVHHKYINEMGNTHPNTDTGVSGGRSSRTEVYGRGGVPGEPELTANPSDNATIEVEFGIQFAEVRSYQIDQPNSEYIHVRSTSSDDTELPVELETVDGSTSESLTLDSSDATTAVATSSTMDSLRVSVPEEHTGTIEVYADDGSGTDAPGAPGQLLTFIRGSETYDDVTSDHGLPLLGSGSFEQASALSDPISAVKSAGRWDGHAAAQQIMGSTVAMANNVEAQEPAGTFAADIKEGQLEPTAECTVYGETESTDYFGDHIEGREGELRIPTTRGDIVFPRAYVSEGGSTEQEAGSAVMQVDVTFRALQPTDGSDAVMFDASA